MGMSMKHRTQRVENEAFFSGRIARKPIFNSRSLVNSLALHRLLAFGTGLSFGCLLAGVIALAFLFATPQAASEPNAVKSRGVTINTPEAKSAAPSAATADSEDFIDGNFWALIIGINKYPTMDADKQLEAARKDAEAISKLLVDRYGFSKERMTELYDEAASRKGIIRAFSSLKRRLTEKDSLFIYYAGHGEYEGSKDKKDKDKSEGMGYWIPSDAELDDPSSYIFNSQVKDYLANIPARHIYAVVDSCFSGSLMGRTRGLGLSKSAIKELYQEKSRWILASGGLYPVPDAVDKSKKGHSTFAWHFMKILERNTNPYLIPKEIADPIAINVSNEVQGQLPRSAPVMAAGDEGGQFVFRLRKEFLKNANPSPGEVAKLEAERAKVAAAQSELTDLESQLKKAEEALKKQQEEMAARKQAMLDRLKQAQDQAVREKAAEEKARQEAAEREARLKAETDRLKQLEGERLAAAKKFEQEQKTREEKAREAELARQKLEQERKGKEERLAALAREAEEQKRKVLEAKKKAAEEQERQTTAKVPNNNGPAPRESAKPAAVIVEATLRPFSAPKAKDLATAATIAAGYFIMGSKPGDGQPDEAPQRKVWLDSYTIDKYEVTVAQYADYLKKSGAEPPDFWERANQKEDGNRPVVGVDWLEANEYCEYYGKRLPTEAQWEKAARGDDGRKYSWGNDEPGPLFANYATGVAFTYGKSLSTVGSYENGKSPYGVYDMVGNVWEWVLDWHDKTYYQSAPAKNPVGPGSGEYKVIRGGSWSKRPAIARVAGRMYLSPSQRTNSLGFRCAGEAH